MKEDEILFEENNNNTDIDFLLYYYTTNQEKYEQDSFDSKFSYEIKSAGNIVLNLPDFESMNLQSKVKPDDLNISVIISQDVKEFEYMDSICYLSRKLDKIESQNLYKDIKINIHKNKKKIEINKLDKKTDYYINVLITNKKTGQIFALDPLQIIPYIKISTIKSFTIALLIIILIVLLFVIFYLYRKYRIAKAIVNYEKNDIKNMGSIPKSITELKKIQEEKNKKAKEKYNSLTEDSGEI